MPIRRKIISKYYSKSDNSFHLIFEYNDEKQEEIYSNLKDFYLACNRNLKNADLIDYDFEGIDLLKYDLSNAKINSNTLIKLGIYEDSVLRKIKSTEKYSELVPSEYKEIIPTRIKYGLTETYPEYDDNDNIFLYISDLHINHKLIKKFIHTANINEVNKYFEKIVKSLNISFPNSYNKNVFIVGDVSYDFDFLVQFFKVYSENISWCRTYFILGNHETWDLKLWERCETYDDLVKEYKKALEPLNIYVLESEVIISGYSKDSDTLGKGTCEQILKASDKEIIEVFRHSSYAILAGMGFAGLNYKFNAQNNIYGESPISRDYEIKRSRMLSDTHKKLKRLIPHKKLIVVTHMPFNDWCSDTPNPNWIYVSGHTHKNIYEESDELTLYADNQIGYFNDSYGFKFFALSPRYNIFESYCDGIHEISREDYQIFNRGLRIKLTFNRYFYKLYLVKRSKTYMFFVKIDADAPLYYLNGGSIYGTNGHNIHYFYDEMVNYSKSVNIFLDKYLSFMKSVSKEVKQFGGTGKIHGCIVDIDYFNHLYINPLDKSITAYNANSKTEKYVYSNVASLLNFCVPELFEKYVSLINSKEKNSELNLIVKDTVLVKKAEYVEDTEMYRISNIIKGLQYTTDFNIIRLWKDSFVSQPNEEIGKLIVSNIIEQNIHNKEQK